MLTSIISYSYYPRNATSASIEPHTIHCIQARYHQEVHASSIEKGGLDTIQVIRNIATKHRKEGSLETLQGSEPSLFRKKCRNRHFQCLGYLLDIIDTHISLAALDIADVGAVQPAGVGQNFLGPTLFKPQLANSFCQHVPCAFCHNVNSGLQDDNTSTGFEWTDYKWHYINAPSQRIKITICLSSPATPASSSPFNPMPPCIQPHLSAMCLPTDQ